MEFHEVSRAMGVEPSKLIEKGSRSFTGRPREVNTWIFNSALGELETVEAHIRWIASHLPNLDRVKSLRELQGVEDIDIFCAISADATECGICLSADVLDVCKRMSCDLEFSLVFGNQTASTQGVDEAPRDAEVNLSTPGFTSRSSACVTGRLSADTQALLSEAFRRSLDGESIVSALSAGRCGLEFEMTLKAEMMEVDSPDIPLTALRDALSGQAQQLLRLGEPDSLKVHSRTETNCEWPSKRFSFESFDLPLLLSCPLIMEAVLI